MSNKPTSTATTSRWANRTKEAAAAVPLSKPTTASEKKDYGTRFTATVESFTPTSYSTGAFGVKIKYAVDGLDRAVYENVVLKTVDPKTGNFQETKYGLSSLKRRLSSFGLTTDEVTAFPMPITAKDESDAYTSLGGARVTVYLKDREYMGKLYKDVKSTWPIDGDNQ